LQNFKGVLRVKPTKTRKSRRRISLSQPTLDLLASQRALYLSRVTSARDDGLMFSAANGSYLQVANFRVRIWRPLLVKAGLNPDLHFHALRHTCASLLLLANVHPKVVSERLGHSSIAITLDTYSHLLPTMQADAAVVIRGLLT
jgi:integrase